MVTSVFNFIFSIVVLLAWSVIGSKQKGKIKRLMFKSSFIFVFLLVVNAIILIINVYNY